MSPPSAPAGVRAAMRDASFYATHRVPTVGGYVPRYHVVADNGSGPACNPDGMLLVATDADSADCTIAAAHAPVAMRCRRLGCAKRWPAAAAGGGRGGDGSRR